MRSEKPSVSSFFSIRPRPEYIRKAGIKKKNAVIIGAGLGGLATAIRLAALNIPVDVIEQSPGPGGKANTISAAGYRFDTGPSLLTMPFVVDDLFAAAGKKREDYLTVTPLSVLCKYFWNDGTVFTAHPYAKGLAADIAATFNEPVTAVERYFKYTEKLYNLTAQPFLFSAFNSLGTLLKNGGLKTLLSLPSIDPFRTMHKANSAFFKNPKLIQLFDRYATYNGSNPFLAPATLNIIQYVEFVLGGYVIKGGMYALSTALLQLAGELGVKFHFNTQADKIEKVQGRARYVRFGETLLQGDAIVSNLDARLTFSSLLRNPGNKEYTALSKAEPSTSAIVFYWGVNTSSPALEIHNILFSEDYGKEFNFLFKEKEMTDDPTVYIYISSKFNTEDAPAGKENWFVMVNAPAGYTANKEQISRIKASVLAKIKTVLGISIEDKIETEQILTPEMIEQKTGSLGGSLYGNSSNDKYAAFLRQKNKSKTVPNLYFAGGSVHPGGGIPLVLLSGKHTADIIIKEFKE